MKNKTINLLGDSEYLCVEAYPRDGSIDFTIERSPFQSAELRIPELEKLRDFLNNFLNECDEIERLKEEHAGQ